MKKTTKKNKARVVKFVKQLKKSLTTKEAEYRQLLVKLEEVNKFLERNDE